jgi:hypothetical protein
VTNLLLKQQARKQRGRTPVRDGNCYLTLDEAITRQSKKECGCNKAETIGFTYNHEPSKPPCIPIVAPDGRISCYHNQIVQEEVDMPSVGSIDFGFYYEGCLFHAQRAFRYPTSRCLCSTAAVFHNSNGSNGFRTSCCVACSGKGPMK